MGFGEWLDRANEALGGEGAPEKKKTKAEILLEQRKGLAERKLKLENDTQNHIARLYAPKASMTRAQTAEWELQASWDELQKIHKADMNRK